MPVTTSEFRDTLPDYDEIARGSTLTINGTEYTISDKKVRSPAPGESVNYLYLDGNEGTKLISWSPAHTVEEVRILGEDEDPMMDGEAIETVGYSPAE